MASSRAAEALVVATLLAAACAEGNAAGSRPDAAATRPDAALGREAAPGSRSGREQAACAPASARDAGATPECAACVDRELAARGLNQFGDPPDAVYAGGTPLFDERTGKATDRVEYVLSHHQAIAAACGAIESPGRPTGG